MTLHPPKRVTPQTSNKAKVLGKWDRYAEAALSALLVANPDYLTSEFPDCLVADACRIADAMVKAQRFRQSSAKATYPPGSAKARMHGCICAGNIKAPVICKACVLHGMLAEKE